MSVFSYRNPLYVHLFSGRNTWNIIYSWNNLLYCCVLWGITVSINWPYILHQYELYTSATKEHESHNGSMLHRLLMHGVMCGWHPPRSINECFWTTYRSGMLVTTNLNSVFGKMSCRVSHFMVWYHVNRQRQGPRDGNNCRIPSESDGWAFVWRVSSAMRKIDNCQCFLGWARTRIVSCIVERGAQCFLHNWRSNAQRTHTN